jgi:hypothetical protein
MRDSLGSGGGTRLDHCSARFHPPSPQRRYRRGKTVDRSEGVVGCVGASRPTGLIDRPPNPRLFADIRLSQGSNGVCVSDTSYLGQWPWHLVARRDAWLHAHLSSSDSKDVTLLGYHNQSFDGNTADSTGASVSIQFYWRQPSSAIKNEDARPRPSCFRRLHLGSQDVTEVPESYGSGGQREARKHLIHKHLLRMKIISSCQIWPTHATLFLRPCCSGRQV